MKDNLLDAIALAREGRKTEARWLLERVLEVDRANETAWLWYADCAETPAERISALESCLRANPNATLARAALNRLNGTKPAPASEAQPGMYRALLQPAPPAGEEVPEEERTKPVRIRPAWARVTAPERPMVAVTGAASAAIAPVPSIRLESPVRLEPVVHQPPAVWKDPAVSPERAAEEKPADREEIEDLVDLADQEDLAGQEDLADQADLVDLASLDDLIAPVEWAQPEALPGARPLGGQAIPEYVAKTGGNAAAPAQPLPAQNAPLYPGVIPLAVDPFNGEALHDPLDDTRNGTLHDPFAETDRRAALFRPEDSPAEKELALLDALMREEETAAAVRSAETAEGSAASPFSVDLEAVTEDEFENVAQRVETHLVQQGGPDRPAYHRASLSEQDMDWSALEQMGPPRIYSRRVPASIEEVDDERRASSLRVTIPRPNHQPILMIPQDRDPTNFIALAIITVVVLLIAGLLGKYISILISLIEAMLRS